MTCYDQFIYTALLKGEALSSLPPPRLPECWCHVGCDSSSSSWLSFLLEMPLLHPAFCPLHVPRPPRWWAAALQPASLGFPAPPCLGPGAPLCLPALPGPEAADPSSASRVSSAHPTGLSSGRLEHLLSRVSSTGLCSHGPAPAGGRPVLPGAQVNSLAALHSSVDSFAKFSPLASKPLQHLTMLYPLPRCLPDLSDGQSLLAELVQIPVGSLRPSSACEAGEC